MISARFFNIISAILLAIAIVAVVCAFFPGVMSGLAPSPTIMEIDPSPAFTCKAQKGAVVKAVFTVKNVTREQITLLGARSGCSCAVAEGLPLKLTPGASDTFSLRVTVAKFDSAGVFTKSAELFTNVDGIVPPLVVKVSSIDAPKNP